MNRVDRIPLVLAGVGIAALAMGTGSGGVEFGTLLVAGGAFTDREGIGALVAWIVGGAILGGAIGYGVHVAVDLPVTMFGAVGMGAAMGGGLGGMTHFLAYGEEELESDTGVTVDMGGDDDDPAPRPADLFDDHPDPVLYVADEGGGIMIRAANDAYGETFDLPTATLAGAPLVEALRPAGDGAEPLGDVVAEDTVDREVELATADATATFRVRSVGDLGDGYLLFTRD